MKRVVAIFLSLMLMMLQVMATAPTTSSAATPQCGCCVSTQQCCCVTPATPAPTTAPLWPAPVSAPSHLVAVAIKVTAWILPDSLSAVVSSFDSSSALWSAVPLFQRDCALLI